MTSQRFAYDLASYLGTEVARHRRHAIKLSPLPKLIGVAGRINHGKDWICNIVSRATQAHTVTLGFGDPLYRAAAGFLNVPEDAVRDRSAKDGDEMQGCPIPLRSLLQRLGRWARSEVGEDWLIEIAAERINQMAVGSIPDLVMVTGLRCANEADWIHRHGGEVWYVRDYEAARQKSESDRIERSLPIDCVDRFLIRGPGRLPIQNQVVAELKRLGIALVADSLPVAE